MNEAIAQEQICEERKEICCEECKKIFTSNSNLLIHKREKHSFYNTKDLVCDCCLKIFKSAIFNNKKNKYYNKCEECRDLEKSLNTSLKHGKYVYGLNYNRYYIDAGIAIEACKIYDCFEDINCNHHDQKQFAQCKSSNCNNCFLTTGYNLCERCRNDWMKANDKRRNTVKEFKIKLGGKCVDCNSDDLFSLEFDHIDPKKKTVQITRSKPSDWIKEESNLELRCSICHRIKTDIDRQIQFKTEEITKYKKLNIDRKLFIQSIKKAIGKCQICDWTIDDKTKMCCALDFDHIYQMININKFQHCIHVQKKR